MQLFYGPVQSKSRGSKLVVSRETIRAEAQPITASIGYNIVLCQFCRQLPGIRVSNREKRAVAGIATYRLYAGISQIALQSIELR